MTFKYRPAVLEGATVFIGLAGPSGSGKTYSALRIATGLAQGKPIYMVDTEARRGLHYANQFEFMHGELAAPFRPSSYEEAIAAAKKAGAGCIVVDSMSHEHEGPGGVLEWHEEELYRMAKDDWAKREKVKFTAWIKPKRARNQLINSILQLGVHCVFCFRAKEKIALIKDDKGKIVPTPMGWQPIVGDRFEYEMTALLTLPPNSKGVPDLEISKMQDQLLPFFKKGAQLDEAMGERLAKWAQGGGDRKSTKLSQAVEKVEKYQKKMGVHEDSDEGAASPPPPPPATAPDAPPASAGGGSPFKMIQGQSRRVVEYADAMEWKKAWMKLIDNTGKAEGLKALREVNAPLMAEAAQHTDFAQDVSNLISRKLEQLEKRTAA